MAERPVPRVQRRDRRAAEREARRGLHAAPASRSRRLGLGAISGLAVTAGVALIAIVVVLGGPPRADLGGQMSVTPVALPPGTESSGMVLGRPDAPVTLDLYEDFQCPACRVWGESVFPSLLANEVGNGTVRVVFHDMAFLGEESVEAGYAAYAAAEQGRFWDMWLTLYANQGPENSGVFDRPHLRAMAVALGLDLVRFEADMDSEGAQESLATAARAAAASGVTVTPTIVIDGTPYPGVGTYPELAAVIATVAK